MMKSYAESKAIFNQNAEYGVILDMLLHVSTT